MKEAIEYLIKRKQELQKEADIYKSRSRFDDEIRTIERIIMLNDIQMVITLIKHEQENK